MPVQAMADAPSSAALPSGPRAAYINLGERGRTGSPSSWDGNCENIQRECLQQRHVRVLDVQVHPPCVLGCDHHQGALAAVETEFTFIGLPRANYLAI